MRRTMPSIASAAPNITPARMHSSVRVPITRVGTMSSVAGSFDVRRVSVSADVQDARRDHAAEEDAVGRDAVEGRGGAHVDDDRVAREEPARRERVDEPIGADGERLVDVRA